MCWYQPQVEIAELEALRRDLWKAEQEVAVTKGAGSTSKGRSRLPPGPFSGGMLAGEETAAGKQARSDPRELLFEEEVYHDRAAGDVGRELEEERYTANGLKLALPRRRRTTIPSPSVSPTLPPDEAFVPSAYGVAGGAEGDVFDQEQDFNDPEGQMAELDPLLEQAAVSGGYPKRLAGLMAFCRVSDKDTCEILVAMGRVTVNGVVVQDPGMKVDVLTDMIVANGEIVVVAISFRGLHTLSCFFLHESIRNEFRVVDSIFRDILAWYWWRIEPGIYSLIPSNDIGNPSSHSGKTSQ